MFSRTSLWNVLWCVFALVFGVNISRADGTFVSAPSRVDVLPDAARHILYISSTTQVLRYNWQKGSFETPYVLSGILQGMDISPEGNLLAVADSRVSKNMVGIFLVDLKTGVSRRVQWVPQHMESGSFSVAFTASGKVLVTSKGAGWISLRVVDPVKGIADELGDISQNTMLCASANRAIVGFAETNNSGGPFGFYRDKTGELVRSTWSGGTQGYNYEIGTNRDGTQFAVPTYLGTFIYNASLQKTRRIGAYAAGQPIGVAYNPTKNVAYFPWAGSSQIRAYNTDSGELVGTFEAESPFTYNGSWAFVNGRTRVSPDAALLVTTVDKGVRFWNLKPTPAVTPTPTPTTSPNATPTPTSSPNVPRISVVLSPNNPRTKDRVVAYASYSSRSPLVLRYEWYCGSELLPEKGSVLDLSRAGYGDKNDTVIVKVTPYLGALRGVTASATVRVQNTPPILVDKTARTVSGTAIEVVLPATDNDDGDTLKFTLKSQPLGGTATIEERGGKFVLTYSPRADWTGQEALQLRVTDSSNASDDGIVAIAVTAPKTTTSDSVALNRRRHPFT